MPIFNWIAAIEPLKGRCPLQYGFVEDILGNKLVVIQIARKIPTQQQKLGKKSISVNKKITSLMCRDNHVCLNSWR